MSHEQHFVRPSVLRIRPDELIIDSFAGGGGASLGIEMALGRSPDIAVNHDAAVLARFWSRVSFGEGCWEWQGSALRRASGIASYGVFSLGKRGKQILAHRFSYQIAHGTIDEGLVIRHQCDNPKCVRPDHLIIGTQADNLADMRSRGRAFFNTFPKGVCHPNAKIDTEIVRIIRKLRAEGLSFAKIGAKVGLHPSTIHDIVTGKTWGQVQ